MSHAGAARGARLALLAMEVIIGVALVIAIVLSAVSAFYIAYSALRNYREYSVTHTDVLSVLDLAVLMLLATDLMRTLVTTIERGRMTIRSIIEVGALVLVREMISVSIEAPSPVSLTELAGGLALLVVAWMVLRRFVGEEE